MYLCLKVRSRVCDSGSHVVKQFSTGKYDGRPVMKPLVRDAGN
jgi:hypothetical protein